MALSPSHIEAGRGRIVLRCHGSTVCFSELSSTYPLKLLSPRIDQKGTAVVYALTYGGGLVGGDSIHVSVDVGPGAAIVLLSQGSTKVFKTRPGDRACTRPSVLSSGFTAKTPVTTQILDVIVADASSLFLLPDPVTCFRSASYNQTQTFRLAKDASVVILDWITSGRKSLGEEWAFCRYYSANEIWIDGKRVAKDVVLLDDQEMDIEPLSQRTLKDRLSPFSCYATVVLYGPVAESAIRDMTARYEATSVYKTSVPADLIWSLSPISGTGCTVRVAGMETESVRGWLGDELRELEDVIGIDVYRKAFA